jgi:hypothetical protein
MLPDDRYQIMWLEFTVTQIFLYWITLILTAEKHTTDHKATHYAVLSSILLHALS